MTVLLRMDKACSSIKEKLAIKNLELAAKASVITLVVAAYAVTAFASLAFVFSGVVFPVFLILGSAPMIVTIMNLSTVADLIKEHKMLTHTENNRGDIRKFVAAAIPDLLFSIALTTAIIGVGSLMNSIFLIARAR